MSSALDSRDDVVERGSIPLDIDNIHMLLQGQCCSARSLTLRSALLVLRSRFSAVFVSVGGFSNEREAFIRSLQQPLELKRSESSLFLASAHP